MRKKICCVTGHRDLPQKEINYVKAALELIAVIPYQKRLDNLNEKGRIYKMLEACAEVIVVQEKSICLK